MILAAIIGLYSKIKNKNKEDTTMHVQDEIQKLMQKDMDRKDFLKHVGVGFATIAGFTTVLKTITTLNGSQQQSMASGYGGGAYGGASRSVNKSQG